MKKKQVKKLRLSRETLQTLTSSDIQDVVGGADGQTSTITSEPLTGNGGGACCNA